MMTIEEIRARAEGVDEDIHEPTVVDILVELRACLPTCVAADRAGLVAAIEIIETNYL